MAYSPALESLRAGDVVTARPKPPIIRRLEEWFPVILYTGLIFTLSSIPTLAPPGGFVAEDKVCHLLEYMGWGLLVRRALDRGHVSRTGRPLKTVMTILLGGVMAVLDESFQRTVGRHYAVTDMMADWTGVFLAQPVYELLVARVRMARRLDV
jgi:VanZ family protein